jgi:parvulin-like peptidyl-prolyl isomerase
MIRVPAQAGEGERAQIRAQLTDLRNKILANQIDFAQAAKQYSHGITKDAGGDLDWFPHIRLKWMMLLPESVVETAFTLQPGQISEVFESDAGMHLIKVIDRKAGQPSDFAKIKDDVRQLCIEQMQQAVLEQLRKEARIVIHLP